MHLCGYAVNRDIHELQPRADKSFRIGGVGEASPIGHETDPFASRIFRPLDERGQHGMEGGLTGGKTKLLRISMGVQNPADAFGGQGSVDEGTGLSVVFHAEQAAIVAGRAKRNVDTLALTQNSVDQSVLRRFRGSRHQGSIAHIVRSNHERQPLPTMLSASGGHRKHRTPTAPFTVRATRPARCESPTAHRIHHPRKTRRPLPAWRSCEIPYGACRWGPTGFAGPRHVFR